MSETPHYQEPLDRFEGLDKFALAEQIADIQSRERDHQVALATTLRIGIPNVTERRTTSHASQKIMDGLMANSASSAIYEDTVDHW
jgi:hypothetical protein